ncbi:uncharacterized protein LOC115885492 [Sitophilus oryzae]|uniref:Uncharacterized protein LOC115885492 n=1 Tax=Sitophilus oryzae TaxID=7048 RepID=A0A6J2YBJ7_SITOR|nr:uncharacterized protein LOC115885492 [Sitophilus oryzae]
MRSALTAIRRGRCSQRVTAMRFKIPRRTLRDHLKSRTHVKKIGRKSILSKHQEQDLVKRIVRLAEIGVPLTMKLLRHNVFRFCKINKIKNNSNEEKCMTGRDWMRMFLNRNPEISKRKAQFMNQARAQKLNKFIVDDHFKKLGKLLDNLELKQNPAKIFDMDEKDCPPTLHHQPAVLVKKGSQRVHFIANEHAESVTIVGCVSAIPPMIIFKGKRLKSELTNNLHREVLLEWYQKDL